MRDLVTQELTLQGVTHEDFLVYFIPKGYKVSFIDGRQVLVSSGQDLYYEPEEGKTEDGEEK